MVALTKKEVERLKVGDEVIYKERSGQLNMYLYPATVIEKHKHFVTLSCLANEISGARFTTSFCYDDGIFYGGYKLFKETLDDYLEDAYDLSV